MSCPSVCLCVCVVYCVSGAKTLLWTHSTDFYFFCLVDKTIPRGTFFCIFYFFPSIDRYYRFLRFFRISCRSCVSVTPHNSSKTRLILTNLFFYLTPTRPPRRCACVLFFKKIDTDRSFKIDFFAFLRVTCDIMKI